MGDGLLTVFSMENHHPSTLLSMDSSASSTHDELDLEMTRQITLTRPPDINIPLSSERNPWNPNHCDNLTVGLSTRIYETETFLGVVPRAVGKKCMKRVDTIWGAWFFFSFYFEPVLNDNSKAKIIRDGNGVSGFDRSDLKLDVFMVQHDMENMYMWVFKEKPENALGKMQLRSYMNGHSRQGERPFPFCPDKGFVRSHRMQRKHYRGLSNPQCVHGVEVVSSPGLMNIDENDRKRWIELTGRELNFVIPPEASDYGSWRNVPNPEFEFNNNNNNNYTHSHSKKLVNRPVLNLSNHHDNVDDMIDRSIVNNKRRKDLFNEDDCYLTGIPDLETLPNGPNWLNGFSGVLRNVYGPVTGAKTTYEDEQGYLILISLPFVDLETVKVSWRNTVTHGIIKVSCSSTSRRPFIKRHDRTFKLTDPSSEHCPSGDFFREIPLSTRIPEDANIEAYYDGRGAVLEILVPKLREGVEEHEVRVSLRLHNEGNDLMLS